jgi:hypothetical protein
LEDRIARRIINKKPLAPASFIPLAVAGMSSPDLVGHWTFEEVSDGIVSDVVGASANTPLGNYPRFGDHPNLDGRWQFSGLMDDIRMYKAALTADDIRTLYNGGL